MPLPAQYTEEVSWVQTGTRHTTPGPFNHSLAGPFASRIMLPSMSTNASPGVEASMLKA
jgi:hypothetical protein